MIFAQYQLKNQFKMYLNRRCNFRLLQFLVLGIFCHFDTSHASPQMEGVTKVDRSGANPSTPVRRPTQNRDSSPGEQMKDPRRWMFLAVVAFLLIGGGRKWHRSWQGRKLANRIADGLASSDEILLSSRYGRIAVPDLFHLLSSTETEQTKKNAALRALISLWREDELIIEEEKAIIIRSFEVQWKHRRKYPRDMTGSFTIHASFGLPQLIDNELTSWLEKHLQWSSRITGSRRATDQQWKTSDAFRPKIQCDINPEDFPENSVHRIGLYVRLKTRDLSSNWELELPATNSSFEWDEYLQTDALKAPFSDEEANQLNNALQWVPIAGSDQVALTMNHVKISPEFAVANPPLCMVQRPLPRDLAHQIYLEIQGVSRMIPVGEWVVALRNSDSVLNPEAEVTCPPWEISPEDLLSDSEISRAGNHMIRLILEPVTHRGWANPDVRSVYSGRIEMPWINVELVRL